MTEPAHEPIKDEAENWGLHFSVIFHSSLNAACNNSAWLQSLLHLQ